MILTSYLALLSCKTDAQKLQISIIHAEPKEVKRKNQETGESRTFMTYKEVEKRLDPGIIMFSKNSKTLKFRIQGNISSSGHSIHKVRKIRLEKGTQNGNTITLRYYVEIKKQPGKESANVKGYHYSKDETYTIPNDVKVINIELYEDQINEVSDTLPRLISKQTFNFFAKM
ncbi:hypothetical protein CW752_01520 [Chryseobacterium sp. PMSZPI]|nr:hypothetical protein CW752_01520 [Chryseobacterium sp. PMSZPI]